MYLLRHFQRRLECRRKPHSRRRMLDGIKLSFPQGQRLWLKRPPLYSNEEILPVNKTKLRFVVLKCEKQVNYACEYASLIIVRVNERCLISQGRFAPFHGSPIRNYSFCNCDVRVKIRKHAFICAI